MTARVPNHDLEKMKPTAPQTKPSTDQEKQAFQQLIARIGNHVIHILGQPGDLQVMQVRYLWPDHFRVNIFVGVDGASAKVAHSYFLVVDSDGNILASTPQLTKQY